MLKEEEEIKKSMILGQGHIFAGLRVPKRTERRESEWFYIKTYLYQWFILIFHLTLKKKEYLIIRYTIILHEIYFEEIKPLFL